MAPLPFDIEDDQSEAGGRFMLSMRWKVSIVGLCFLIILGSVAWSGVPRFVEAVKGISAPASEEDASNDSQESGIETPVEEGPEPGRSTQVKYPGYQSLLFNDMDPLDLVDWQGGEIRICRDRSIDGSQGPGSWTSQPLDETTLDWHSLEDGHLALILPACEPDGQSVADCADSDSPVKLSYRWNGLEKDLREAPSKVMETRIRCSDINVFGGAMGWGFSAMSKPNELDEGLILVDDLSFFSPYAMGPRFESYSAESDSSLEGFWITSSDSRGEITRRPVTGIDLTDWHTYTIFWEEGNATFLIDGARVGELLSQAGDVSSEQALPGGMGASVYLENTIYSPENEDQASFDCLDSLLRDFQDGASRLGSQVPSFRYGAADLEDDRWLEIDYVSFFGMPEQAALIGGGFIADPHLESVITETLGVSKGLSREDMLSLTTLSAWSRGITSLGGLEYASNLEELSLPNNTITEISPLSGLNKLRSLRLDGNGIDDISPLEGLGSLKTLHIDTEYMDDLSPISSMTGLEELTVGWSARFDLSLLTDLTSLRMLKLSHDDVFDLSPLSNLANLRELWILGNRILDLSPLIRLERLEKLVLSEGYESLPSGSPAWPDISTLNETGVIVQFTGC